MQQFLYLKIKFEQNLKTFSISWFSRISREFSKKIHSLISRHFHFTFNSGNDWPRFSFHFWTSNIHSHRTLPFPLTERESSRRIVGRKDWGNKDLGGLRHLPRYNEHRLRQLATAEMTERRQLLQVKRRKHSTEFWSQFWGGRWIADSEEMNLGFWGWKCLWIPSRGGAVFNVFVRTAEKNTFHFKKTTKSLGGCSKIPSNDLKPNCFWRGADCSPEGKFIREESMLSGHWPPIQITG